MLRFSIRSVLLLTAIAAVVGWLLTVRADLTPETAWATGIVACVIIESVTLGLYAWYSVAKRRRESSQPSESV